MPGVHHSLADREQLVYLHESGSAFGGLEGKPAESKQYSIKKKTDSKARTLA
jgi:hypothetical protein